MTLKCHISFRKQNKHKKSSIKKKDKKKKKIKRNETIV